MAVDLLGFTGSRKRNLRLRVETDRDGLRKLKIRGKDLDEIPREVFNMLELETLDLSPERESCLYYRMTEVPGDIGKLANLKVLMLDTNGLHQLPSELSLLANLERISLSNNHLVTLPEGFGRLFSLRSLHAANNNFQQFPASICELPKLQFLDLCDNKIPSLPDNISDLKTLETLLLFLNQLTELPDALCHVITLRSLWIGENRITRLPRDFGKLNRLDWGVQYTSSTALDGNPIKDPPIDICKRGVLAIAAYFENKKEFRDQATSQSTK